MAPVEFISRPQISDALVEQFDRPPGMPYRTWRMMSPDDREAALIEYAFEQQGDKWVARTGDDALTDKIVSAVDQTAGTKTVGALIADEVLDEVWTCPKCGRPAPRRGKHCTHCGTRLTGDSSVITTVFFIVVVILLAVVAAFAALQIAGGDDDASPIDVGEATAEPAAAVPGDGSDDRAAASPDDGDLTPADAAATADPAAPPDDDGPVELTDGPWRFFNNEKEEYALWDIRFEPGGVCTIPGDTSVHTCEYTVTGVNVLITLFSTWDPGQPECPTEIETNSWFDMVREGDEMQGIWEVEDLVYSCEDGLTGRGTTRENLPSAYARPQTSSDAG